MCLNMNATLLDAKYSTEAGDQELLENEHSKNKEIAIPLQEVCILFFMDRKQTLFFQQKTDLTFLWLATSSWVVVFECMGTHSLGD